MAQTRGQIPALYDNVDKVMWTLTKSTLKELKPIWKGYYRVESSTKKFERRTSYALFTSTPLKGEGEDYSVQSMDQGYTKDFTHLEFGLACEYTQTAEEDDQYGVLSEYATGLARASRFTEETYAARTFNLGFSGGSETTPDGLSIYNASHTLVKGGTGSNLISQDFSRVALENALTLARTDSKTDEGYFINPPDGYLLEVPPALEFLAHRVVNSSGLPGSADNDVNPIKARYSITIIVNPHISDSDSWRLIAKNKMHGLLSYTRKAIAMEPPVKLPRSGNRLYKIRFRRSWGCDRWQGLIASPGA